VINHRMEKKKMEKADSDVVAIKQKMEEHLRIYRAEREERLRRGRFRKKRAHEPKKDGDEETGPELLVILKGDVDGSVDAILDVLETYHSSLCNLEVLHFGVGSVTLSDVELASTFKAIIYGFNTTVMPDARELAKKNSINLQQFNVIYKLIDHIKEEINIRLPKKKEEQILGEAEVLQEFVVTEGKTKWPVAGSQCKKGVLKKSATFRVKRGEETVFDGNLSSLRHLKNEVESIKKNVECGVRLSDPEVRFQQGDVIICYELADVSQKIDWDPGF